MIRIALAIMRELEADLLKLVSFYSCLSSIFLLHESTVNPSWFSHSSLFGGSDVKLSLELLIRTILNSL